MYCLANLVSSALDIGAAPIGSFKIGAARASDVGSGRAYDGAFDHAVFGTGRRSASAVAGEVVHS